MPDDEQRCRRALSVLAETCVAARQALPTPADGQPPALGLVLADVDALLVRIHFLSTKLALALAPPAPAHSAATPLVDELAQDASALAHAARLLRDHLHGAALTRLVSSCVEDILGALVALVRSFLDNTHDHLLKIALLHDLISDARGISKDNQAAVHRAWKSNRASLEDNLREIADVIKQAESSDHAPGDVHDGWDEIGLDHASNLDKDELDCAKNVHQILRLTTLLHRRIFLDLLSHPSSAPPSTFDALLLQSNKLLSTSDDLVAALYPPLDSDQVRAEISQLVDITTSLQTQLPVFLPTPEQPAAPTSASPLQRRADKRWFDTCVNQILGLCSDLTAKTSNSRT